MTANAGDGAAAPNLSQPLYGASMGQAVVRFFKKYARFKGYASRSEHWWVALAQFVLYVVLGGIYVGIFAGLVENSPNMETATTATSTSFEAEGAAAVVLGRPLHSVRSLCESSVSI